MIGILLDREHDLAIGTEGLMLGETTAQCGALILQCHKGEIKELPALGVGISDMLLDHDPLRWRRIIREQLELDGQSVRAITITHSDIIIDAEYTNA